MNKELMSGNAAIARGAWEGGVTVATGYPGTPSTEILENVVRYKQDIYCEWSPNEKVAFEVGAAASLAGARVIVTMKHVGLNVAADPLLSLGYVGTVGGMAVIVADDPGMHSSQNEQDTRHYARFAKIPILEPSDSQEAKDFVRAGLELSEKYRTPVILRTTTCISHSRALVQFQDRVETGRPVGFEKHPPTFVPIPVWARQMRLAVEERTKLLIEEVNQSPLNRIEWRDRNLGIVTASVTYQHIREIWPKASILKLGFSYPFPDEKIKEFARGVDKLLIAEELDPILEEHVLSLGIECQGQKIIPSIGELTPTRLREARSLWEGKPQPQKIPGPNLPGRPPVLCAGCPHRGIFSTLGKHDVVVTGDIGCYSLGTLPPLNRMDTILCMGGGVSMAHGMDKAGEGRKVVGIVGDSTFFHSGITGLLDIAYNKGNSTIIVVDNRTTAMTGHQDNPGTGKTLMGEEAPAASISELGRACGIKRIFEINPYDLEETNRVISTEINTPEPSLIVSLAPCILKEREPLGPILSVDPDRCQECKLCLKVGCPAIESTGGPPKISPHLCNGCGICRQICPFEAIVPSGGEQ